MIIAIVLAAGSGARMGTQLPKQFLELEGKPVAYYSLNTFYRFSHIDKVLLVTAAEYLATGKELSRRYFGSEVAVCTGGADRNESLMRALEYIREHFGLDEDTIVLTHDAARPFVSEKMIADNLNAMREADACDTCVAAVDTVIEAENGFAVRMPERAFVYNCQTPQTFKAKMLWELYHSLSEEQKRTLTDAGKIFFLTGRKVKIVEGSPDNIKITFPSDIDTARAILKR